MLTGVPFKKNVKKNERKIIKIHGESCNVGWPTWNSNLELSLIKKQQKLALPDHQQPPLMSLQNNHTTRSRHAQSNQHSTVGHFTYFGSISFHMMSACHLLVASEFLTQFVFVSQKLNFLSNFFIPVLRNCLFSNWYATKSCCFRMRHCGLVSLLRKCC